MIVKLKDLLPESIDEILLEPKRKNPVGISTLVKSGDGVNNIINVYNAATDEEKDYWGKWYHHANADIKELTSEYADQLTEFENPFEVMAAIVAVLSPGNKWALNISAARKIMENAKRVNAYPKNVIKANFIKLTGDTSLATGPKVIVFFNSLLDPKSVETHMVLDGHAINIWRGEKFNLKGLKDPNKHEREIMINGYQEASRRLNVPVQAIQAVTWYIWKYSSNDLKPAPEVPNTQPK